MHLAADCVKLRYLLKYLQDEGAFDLSRQNPPRYIIFVQWLLVLWLVEMLIDALSLNYVAILHSPQCTHFAVNEFNNPESRCQVLLTTFDPGIIPCPCAVRTRRYYGATSEYVHAIPRNWMIAPITSEADTEGVYVCFFSRMFQRSSGP